MNSYKHIGGRLFASGPRSTSPRLRIPLADVSLLICIGGGSSCIICLFADAAYAAGSFDFFQFGNNAEGSSVPGWSHARGDGAAEPGSQSSEPVCSLGVPASAPLGYSGHVRVTFPLHSTDFLLAGSNGMMNFRNLRVHLFSKCTANTVYIGIKI